MRVSKPLADALRRNRCKELRRRMLEELAVALDRDPESFVVADFETTDHLWETYQQTLSNATESSVLCRKWIFSEQQLVDIETILKNLLMNIPNDVCYLFRALSRDCGAIMMKIHDALSSAFHLLELDQEDMFVISEDGQSFVVLTYVTDPTPEGERPFYYLLIGGHVFVKALESNG